MLETPSTLRDTQSDFRYDSSLASSSTFTVRCGIPDGRTIIMNTFDQQTLHDDTYVPDSGSKIRNLVRCVGHQLIAVQPLNVE
jgi:hypothetical protein